MPKAKTLDDTSAVIHSRTLESSGSKVFRYFTQDESGYINLHTNPAQACANCRYFKVDWDGEQYCHLVESYPEPILATGYCNEWRANNPPPEPEPIEVIIVSESMGDDDMMEKIGQWTPPQREQAAGVMQKFLNLMKRGSRDESQVLSAFKFLDNDRWAAVYSNNWRDNDLELFPEAAIDRFIARAKSGAIPYPELQYAHLSALSHGKTDSLVRVGHHIFAGGYFYKDELSQKIVAFGKQCAAEGRKIGMSHRFWFSPADRTTSGEYNDFETFEITWFEQIPGVQPSNPFTVMEFQT